MFERTHRDAEPPHLLHEREALRNLGFGLITVSTSRYTKALSGESVNDVSKAVAESLIKNSGHRVAAYELVPDDPDKILKAVLSMLSRNDVDVVITMGGTGPSLTDVTVETLRPLFEKELEGFGQLFRVLSYQEIGASAILSNATAGIRGGKALFCLPGSPLAVRLALERLILPVIGHLLALARPRRR